MTDYIESKIGEHGKILIEVTNAKQKVGFGPQENGEEFPKIDNAFNQALNTIRLAANSVLTTLDTLENRPDQVKLDFAIAIDPEAGAMLAKGNNTDAQLRVSLGWHKPSSEQEDEETESDE